MMRKLWPTAKAGMKESLASLDSLGTVSEFPDYMPSQEFQGALHLP
jgi:hypothetical protein